MKNICLHHNDLDGRLSAVLVANHFADKNQNTELVELDYKSFIDYPAMKDANVVAVDMCFQPAQVENILAVAGEFTWIDHHPKSLEHNTNVPGIRSEEGAGCLLTHKYYYKTTIPRIVKHISDFDTNKYEYGLHTTYVYWYMTSVVDSRVTSMEWNRLLRDDADVWMDVYTTGRKASDCAAARAKDLEKNMYVASINGHRCFVLNTPPPISAMLKYINRPGGVDIMAATYFNGKLWTTSLYSDTVDVRKICESYGGGGHVGAAGFSSKLYPFDLI